MALGRLLGELHVAPFPADDVSAFRSSWSPTDLRHRGSEVGASGGDQKGRTRTFLGRFLRSYPRTRRLRR